MLRRVFAWGVLAALLTACLTVPVQASNTGGLRGRIVDSSSGAPIAGAKVTAESPEQLATAFTDANGDYRFISLPPDTYVVRAEKTGYTPGSQPGISVFADQVIQANLSLEPTMKTIASVLSRSSAGTQLRPGTTADVYSVNATGIKTAAGAAGAGSMNQAYAAISTVPGVNITSNQQGWYQNIYVRGGNIDQVAYEFDGLPVMRQSDLGAITTLTTLGSQEVQVYTGGTSANSNSSGLAGYINQVVKTGTSPGYADVTLAAGTPTFYHSATAEVSGATPNRTFSYYVGLAGSNQDYRYTDQYNGVSNPLYFYPLNIPTSNANFNVLDGSCAQPGGSCVGDPNFGAVFAPGASYAQGTNYDRENVVNLHFALPHKNSPTRDDIQLLYVVGGINTQFYSSQNELGPAGVAAAFGSYPVTFLDSTFYNGGLMQAPDPSQLVYGPFPSSNTLVPGQLVNPNQRDGSFNGYSIEKFQYQKNFNDHEFLRFLGYGELSNWLINAPTSAELLFGAELADYEVDEHAYGAGLTFSDQLSTKHLLTAGVNFMTQKLQTYNAQFSSTDPNTSNLAPTGLGTVLTSYVDSNGNCYNYSSGQPWSCFDAGSQGGCTASTGCFSGPSDPNINLTPGDCVATGTCAGSQAVANGAHWLVTENGHSAQIDNVRPYFSSYSLTDLWQPNDKLVLNLGARLDHFMYATNDLESGYPARAFWFNAFNREHCGALGSPPVWNGPDPSAFTGCPAGLLPMTDPGNGLYNVPAALSVFNVFQPRVSGTWTLNPNTVLRFSYGKYARAEGSSYYQYNTVQQNLPSFIAQFYSYGYHTPYHALVPDTSNNFDLSLEKRLRGTDMSFKLTPFYRNTRNQLQFSAIDPLGGTLAGLNVGTQKSYGVEFSFQKGDFARNGLAYLLAYTHTTSTITFHPINGINVVDGLNNQIELYNSYTSACAANEDTAQCGNGRYAANAGATLANTQAPSGSPALNITNPYYNNAPQPLLDPGASYPPMNVLPSPFNGANGYEIPNVLSLVLNYRHQKFAITPTFRWNDGATYGSPLTWPGYVPQACAADPAATPVTPGVSCGSGGVIFLPDPYNGNRFDTLGQFKAPSQFTLNLQASYNLTNSVSVTLTAVNVYNRCFQHGYAWDNQQTCVYGTLPSNILAPSGNFLQTSASGLPLVAPIPVRYPYGTFFDITEVGASSVIQPFNLFVNVNFKL